MNLGDTGLTLPLFDHGSPRTKMDQAPLTQKVAGSLHVARPPMKHFFPTPFP